MNAVNKQRLKNEIMKPLLTRMVARLEECRRLTQQLLGEDTSAEQIPFLINPHVKYAKFIKKDRRERRMKQSILETSRLNTIK